MTSELYTPLIKLYKTMDTTFDSIAAKYGFTCDGCRDNCCQSLFYHHTFIEKAYLRYGFKQLKNTTKNTISARAKSYCEATFSNVTPPESLKIMCPVNENGKCLLYPFRPMICRLHGLPHELCRPGAQPVKGPGCDTGRFDDKPYITFDRTEFYRRMAQIEMDFRQTQGKTGKIKQTVAQILAR